MPVLRNTRRGPVVLVDGDDREYNWAGAGDPLGGDYQQVPETVASDANCVRQVRKGILQVVGTEEGDAKLDEQLKAWEQAETNHSAGVQALIDRGHPERETVLTVDDKGHTQRVEQDTAGPTPRRPRHPQQDTEHPVTGAPPPPEADSVQPTPDNQDVSEERIAGPRTVQVPGEDSFVAGHQSDNAESGQSPYESQEPADGPYDGQPEPITPEDSPASYQELIARAAEQNSDKSDDADEQPE